MGSLLKVAVDETEVRRKYRYAWEAKQDELDRLEHSYSWLYEFEKHLQEGEQGRAAYRFPETLGYVNRRYNTYINVLLPEAKVRGENDAAVGLQAAMDHSYRVSNLKREKLRAIKDACGVGSGCFSVLPTTYKRYNREKDKEEIVYTGLSAERIDWRFIFPAPGSLYLHDHTGAQKCPYLFRKKIYHVETFKRLFIKDPRFKNVDKVQPTTWGNANVWSDNEFTTKHESQEARTTAEFITVMEYWDCENDIFQIYASGGVQIYDSPTGIPLSHKELPFHVYYNLKRTDSINGIGEIELNMPYNLFREKILNLGIDDIMLQVQPVKLIDGWVEYNPEKKEIEAGAALTVKGPGVLDDIRKHVMDYSFGGGLNNSVLNMVQLIENSRVAVTSDDTTSLYSNPNQLATQTLAKRETLNRNIDASIKENANDTEFYLANQVASYIKNELAEPTKEEGKPLKYTKIRIQGYESIQEAEDAPVKFEKSRGAETDFALNKDVTEMFDDTEIEVTEAKQDDELKRDLTEKLMQFFTSIFQTISQLAQYNPELLEKIFGEMDVAEFVRITAKNLGLQHELADVFPMIVKDAVQLDAIDAEHKQIMAGVIPQIRAEEDSMSEFNEHMKFYTSDYFKKHAEKDAIKSMKKHLELTAENVQTQTAKPVETRQEELATTQASSGGLSVPGADQQLAGGAVQPGAEQPVPVGGPPVA